MFVFFSIYTFPVILKPTVAFNNFVCWTNVYFVCHCRRCWSPSPVYVATATWLWHHREAHQAFGQLLPGGNPQDWRLPVWGGHQTGSMSSPGQQVTCRLELFLFFCCYLDCGSMREQERMPFFWLQYLTIMYFLLPMLFAGRWWTPWSNISRWPFLATVCQFTMGRKACTLQTHFLWPLVG